MCAPLCSLPSTLAGGCCLAHTCLPQLHPSGSHFPGTFPSPFTAIGRTNCTGLLLGLRRIRRQQLAGLHGWTCGGRSWDRQLQLLGSGPHGPAEGRNRFPCTVEAAERWPILSAARPPAARGRALPGWSCNLGLNHVLRCVIAQTEEWLLPTPSTSSCVRREPSAQRFEPSLIRTPLPLVYSRASGPFSSYLPLFC